MLSLYVLFIYKTYFKNLKVTFMSEDKRLEYKINKTVKIIQKEET